MIQADPIIKQLKNQIAKFVPDVTVEKVGTVLEVGDGIARIAGLSQIASMEMLDFGENTFGVALNLEVNTIGAVILGAYEHIKVGDTVRATGRILSVPVGDALIGRVLSALGEPKDGKGPLKQADF